MASAKFVNVERSSVNGMPKEWMLFSAGAALLLALSYMQGNYEEITWRKFISDYLQKDMVERLEVVNKKWVRVQLKDRSAVSKRKRSLIR